MRLFFFNDTATTEIYTLSLHDALPIYGAKAKSKETVPAEAIAGPEAEAVVPEEVEVAEEVPEIEGIEDRKSTRLNSSHGYISYAVFCLKKKNKRSRQTSNTVCSVPRGS